MFGKNEIVGKKFFNVPIEGQAGKLFVTSIFYTLQGEGPYAGLPAVFVRLAKCNLACSFCDTYFDKGTWMSFEEVNVAINVAIDDFFAKKDMPTPLWATDISGSSQELWMHPGITLVITGGEPTLQNNLAQFLIGQELYWDNIQIETNGTMPIHIYEDIATIVVSPKCVEKDGKPTHYQNISLDVLDGASYLKFVVSADPTSPYHEIPSWAHDWALENEGYRVFISPMNIYNAQPMRMKQALAAGDPTLEEISTVIEKVSFWEPGLLDAKANQANHEYAAQYAMQHGFRLNLQMHLYASIA